jgi:hypothetical protein
MFPDTQAQNLRYHSFELARLPTELCPGFPAGAFSVCSLREFAVTVHYIIQKPEYVRWPNKV